MGFMFRRQKKIGPFRFTLSRSGIGVSGGFGPFRFSRGGAGRKSMSVRTPVRGLTYRKHFK